MMLAPRSFGYIVWSAASISGCAASCAASATQFTLRVLLLCVM
jgi:hypothetical protein